MTDERKVKLELRDVSYIYSAKTPFETAALDHVSVSIREGGITGIIGHTGSGKSTLVQLLNGLNAPTSGKVYLDGEDIWKEPKKITKIRFRVGLVMQYPEYQLFEETIAADIAYGPKNMGLSPEEVAARVKEAAGFVGLSDDLLAKSPFDLSGGQKRRAAIAGVMAMKPEVLVLDEPAAGLDPRGRDEIFGNIRAYQQQSDSTVVVVSHSMEDMAKFCDDVIVLSEAKVVMSGTCHEVFSRAEELTAVGLDIPQITQLTMMLRDAGMPVDYGIYTVEDALCSVLRCLRGSHS